MRKTCRWIILAGLLLGGCQAGSPNAASSSPSVSPSAPSATSPAPVVSTPPASGGVTGPPTGASPTAAPLPAGVLQVSRSGGITGMSQSVTISPDGSWVFTDRKANTTRQGRLTAAQSTQLRGLVASPAFAAEARREPTMHCADGIVSVITVGDLAFRDEGCGGGNHPAADAVIRFVMDATAL